MISVASLTFFPKISQLQFNFTDVHPPNNPLLMARSTPERDFLQSFQSEAQSAAGVAATAISPAISKVQSAAGAATAIPDQVKDMIPRNCSLGTKQFCFGFDNSLPRCKNLPLNLSSTVPEAVKTVLADQIMALQTLPGILTNVTVSNVQDCLILGLALMTVMPAILCSTDRQSSASADSHPNSCCYTEALQRVVHQNSRQEDSSPPTLVEAYA